MEQKLSSQNQNSRPNLGQQLRLEQALLIFFLLKVKIGPTEKIRLIAYIHWEKFRGERDGPISLESRVARAENLVGPDKESEMLALLQKVS